MKQEGTARSLWPRILGYFLGAMLLLTLLSRAADSIMLPVVKCARQLPGALRHTAILSGVIEAREQWPVMAEPGLAVAQVCVRTGQSVKAGETLLTYDTEALQRKLDEKQTALKRLTLQAQLDAIEQPTTDAGGESNKATTDELALKQQISRLGIDEAQREVDRLSQLLFGGATLTAPIDGTINELIVKPGDIVSGAALRISPTSSGLVVRVNVTQDRAKHLTLGMEARFQRSGDARASEGVAVLKGLSPNAAGCEASFDLPDGAGAIGQSVSVAATQDTQTYQMRVPLGAITMNGGITGVYRIQAGQSVLGPMEYAEFVPVTVIETDAQYAAIDPVLSDQDEVIVSSSKPISSGDRVRSSS